MDVKYGIEKFEDRVDRNKYNGRVQKLQHGLIGNNAYFC